MTGGWDCACGATGLSGVRCASCGRTAPWYVPPPKTFEPDPPPPRRLSRRGLVALLLLPLLAVGAVVADETADRRTAARAAERDRVIDALRAFVERERGGPFVEPVRVSLMGDEEFRFVVLGNRAPQPEPLAERPIGSTLRALGLETRGLPPYGDGLVGRFDSKTKRVFVRGKELTPYVKAVIVHELTHAWQDQYLNLGRFAGPRHNGGEEALGIEALVEGDARRVEDAWLETQPPADYAAVIAERERRLGGPDVPAPVAAANALDAFPYVYGANFVRSLHARGGNAAVDKAFERPPVSSEQVMWIDQYDRREAPAEVGYPPAAGAEVDRGTFGAYGLAMVVARGKPEAPTMSAVAGWEGDSYVTWSHEGTLCLEVRIRMESRRSRDRLLRVLRERARPGDGFEKRGADGLDAQFCA